MGGYHMNVALSGLWREKWVNLLCIFNVGVGMFMVAMAALVVYNVEMLTSRLPERFAISAYLAPEVTEKDVTSIKAQIKTLPGVRGIEYISKEDALRDLRAEIEDAEYVLKGLDKNPLPDTVSVSLKGGSVTDDAVQGLVRELKAIKGVEDVQYGQRLLKVIQTIRRNVKLIGGILIAALAAAMVFVSYSTVKILFYRKREEIYTLKLLGATKGFIRAPFLLEGLLIGFFGGALASVAAVFAMTLAYGWLGSEIPLLSSLRAPLEVALALPPVGLVLGFLGSLLAIGRIKF